MDLHLNLLQQSLFRSILFQSVYFFFAEFFIQKIQKNVIDYTNVNLNINIPNIIYTFELYFLHLSFLKPKNKILFIKK